MNWWMQKQLLCLSLLLASPIAWSQHTHVHGEGQLDLAIDAHAVTLVLTLPAEAVLGFERPPATEAEQAQLALAKTQLGDAATLWVFSALAECQATSTEVTLPDFAQTHADFTATYDFHCRQPAALTSLETRLFQSFKHLRHLAVQRIGPEGQGAARLNPKTPRMRW